MPHYKEVIMMEHFVITIAREKCAGGLLIAEELSNRLFIPYYDRDIMRRASDASGINEKLSAANGEDERLGFREMMSAAKKVYTGEVLPPDSNDYVSTKNLFSFQAKVIKEMAEHESCIIIGKCANYLLKDHENVLRLFLYAPMEARKARMAEMNLTWTEKEITKKINSCDKRRSEYYRYYTGDQWRDASNYDVAIDTSKYGIDGSVDLILNLLKVYCK